MPPAAPRRTVAALPESVLTDCVASSELLIVAAVTLDVCDIGDEQRAADKDCCPRVPEESRALDLDLDRSLRGADAHNFPRRPGRAQVAPLG